jgi:hypothetical protein
MEVSMKYLIKVKVNLDTLSEFVQKLQNGELDRSCVRGETYCLNDDPSVGYSVWEVGSREEFAKKFSPWRQFYTNVELSEVISPNEAMQLLFSQKI